jgi:CheY-like chemotaxis protein
MLQTQKMESLGLLAGGVAHDFKNLLIGIIANAQFVRDALRGDPRNASLTEALDDVLLAGRRAGDLVHQMLTYAGRSSTPDEQVALAALAEEAVVLLRASLQPRVSLTRDLPPTLPPICGDSSQLSQLILNLLINASEALGEQGGQLWLRAGECELDAAQLLLAAAGHEAPQPGPYAYVEVEDRGVGISPEQLPRIFDPFYTSKVNGRGLGLAVVLGAVRAHRGVLFVDSEVGRGTRIRAAIPALPAALATTLDAPSDVFDALPAAPRRRYVVVVDDEPVVRSLTQRIFDRYQIPAIICESGPEFLDLLERRPDEIALVLLDFSMPGMSGLDVLAILRTRHPDLPVFLSSGFEQHLMTGIDDDPHTSFISKPYTPVGLMRQLRPALEQTTD